MVKAGVITDASELTGDLTIDADVCIIGSGAGGAVLAAELTAAGKDVVVLEAGGHFTRKDFDMQEQTAYPNLYQDRGGRGTLDQSITILQGRSIGGGTTVNWTSCYRTPERVLDLWAARFGVEGWGAEALAPHFAAVEERLNIHSWPAEKANANNRTLERGAVALGWQVLPMRRNVKGCVDSGFCGMGCPVNGKQAMGITTIVDALAGGARILSNCRVERLVHEAGKVTRIEALAVDAFSGRAGAVRVAVSARTVVVSGGAINTPGILLRSGIDGDGNVGKRTFLHPAVCLIGEHEERIEGFYGAPQSMASHQFIGRGPERVGYFLEAAPLHPMLAATAIRGYGDGLAEKMAKLPHFSALIALIHDGVIEGDDGGTVTVRSDGRLGIDYPINSKVEEGFRSAHKSLAQVHFAGGAKRVESLHLQGLSMTSPADVQKLEKKPYGALEHAIFSAHQMGGCAMGDRPESVVDSELRVRGFKNLYVVDGSVFPTSLGVNPSQSVYGFAHRAAKWIGQ
jgi:choline dehydrogenase-like flavoprotein